MEYSVRSTVAFDSDLKGILSYLVKELKSRQAAEGLIGQVDGAVDFLSVSPFAHAPRGIVERFGIEYRIHPLERYAIVYCVYQGDVFLMRLCHQSQDISNHMLAWVPGN